MAKNKRVTCRAKVRCQNPDNGKYCYPGDQASFIIGPDGHKEIPKHFEEVEVAAIVESPKEAETLLEMQIRDMSTGKIAQYMQVFYGVKIDLGQAQDTAFHEAIGFIRNPEIKRKPDSEIAAGLAAMQNDTPAPEDKSKIEDIPVGQAAPVVPSKDDDSVDDSDSKENAAGKSQKLFKDMTADDIDALDVADIIPMVKKMYDVDMANAGNKKVRLNKALEIEAAFLASKSTILERDK